VLGARALKEGSEQENYVLQTVWTAKTTLVNWTFNSISI
jgi:hypothetical protein